jgi:hypothetical protein
MTPMHAVFGRVGAHKTGAVVVIGGAISVKMMRSLTRGEAVFEHYGNAPDAADVAAAGRAPGAPTFRKIWRSFRG